MKNVLPLSVGVCSFFDPVPILVSFVLNVLQEWFVDMPRGADHILLSGRLLFVSKFLSLGVVWILLFVKLAEIP